MNNQHVPASSPAALAPRGDSGAGAALAVLILIGGLLMLWLWSLLPLATLLQQPCLNPSFTACVWGQLAPRSLTDLRAFGLSPGQYAALYIAWHCAISAIYILVGGLILRRRPGEPLALVAALLFALMGVTWVGSALDALALTRPTWSWPLSVLAGATPALFVAFACLFPDGRWVPRWTRWLAPLCALALGVLAIWPPATSTLTDALFAGEWLVAAGVQLYRYARVSDVLARQQAKWLLSGIAVLGLSVVALLIAGVFVPVLVEQGSLPNLIGGALFNLSLSALPIAIGMAIARYRLWEIDVLINRALVYGALSAGVIGCYVLVVGVLGALLRVEGSLVISLVATGIVAVLFQPLREWLQRRVNRLTFGDRYDPYTALTRLGQRLEGSLAAEDVLDTIVGTVRESLKLSFVSIALDHEGATVPAAATGTPQADALRMPLVHQSARVGELVLGPRAPGEPLSTADTRLLADLARQAGAAVHAVRLSSALRQSRERLLVTREEERRRLRRDLHDGLGPALAAYSLKAGAVRYLLGDAHPAADALLAELQTDIETTMAEVRRLVHNLRPPALDELGLLGAIRASIDPYARQRSADQLQISLEAPPALDGLPAAVEVAAFRIVQEAVANVVRHAQAQRCHIRLWQGAALEIEIADTGVGLSDNRPRGVGLASMRERAEELGGSWGIESRPDGGTRVWATLPCSERAASA